jgi:hypothetical protein
MIRIAETVWSGVGPLQQRAVGDDTEGWIEAGEIEMLVRA